jgi:hypothetical protein
LDGHEAKADAAGHAKGKSLRDTMPHTAELVDWLRQDFGKEAADRIVLRGKSAAGGFYAAEVAADGTLKQFGKSRSGAVAQVLADGTLGWTKGAKAP